MGATVAMGGFATVAPATAVAATTALTSTQRAAIALGITEEDDAILDPSLLNSDGTFNVSGGQTEYGNLPDDGSVGDQLAKEIFRYFQTIGANDSTDASLGEDQYGILAATGGIEDAAYATAIADASSSWWGGGVPTEVASGASDLADGIVGYVSFGAGAFASLLLNPDSAGVLQTVQQSGFVGANPVVSWQLTSDMNADGTYDQCVTANSDGTPTWTADCSAAWPRGSSSWDPSLISAPDNSSGWSVVTFGLSDGSSVGTWPIAVQGACQALSYHLGAPFEDSLGAPSAQCGDGAGDLIYAQNEADFLNPTELGLGPIQLGTPPVGSGLPASAKLTAPSYSSVLGEVGTMYGSSVPLDDLGKALVAIVNNGDEVDGTSPGSGQSERLLEAEEGTTGSVAQACQGLTGAACVSLLDQAGFDAVDEGQAPVYDNGCAANYPNDCVRQAGAVDPADADGAPFSYYNGFDPVGSAEVLEGRSLYSPSCTSSCTTIDKTWSVNDNPGTGTFGVTSGSEIDVYSEPADVVPECDGSGISTIGAIGYYGPLYYPMQFSQCQAALAAAGFTNVVEEPLYGTLWDWFWGCSSDPCDAGEPTGTVEFVTSQDPTTLDTSQGWVDFSRIELGGYASYPTASPVFVYVEGYDGPLVAAPATETTTSTTSTTTTTGDGTTSTGTTTVVTDTGTNPTTTVGGGGSTDATLTIPDCSGLTVPACELTFAEAGYSNVTESWTTPQDGTTAGYVQSTSPAGGATVTAPSPADVSVTIDGAGIVIPAPTPNEVYTDYDNDLQTVGINSADIQDVTLTPAQFDPELPDEGVVTVQPAPGTVVSPGTSVTEQHNPATTPTTNPGPTDGCDSDAYSCSAPDPFPNPTTDPKGLYFPTVPTPCNVFPFGVPCWAASILEELNATPVAPNWTITLPSPGGKTVSRSVSLDDVGGVDLGTVMGYVRPLIVVLFVLGFTLWLARRQSGGGGGGALGHSADGTPLFDGEAPYFDGEAPWD